MERGTKPSRSGGCRSFSPLSYTEQGFKDEVSNLLISLLYIDGKLCAKNFK